MNKDNLTKLGAGKVKRQNLKQPEDVPSFVKDKSSKAKQKKQFKAHNPTVTKNDKTKKFNLQQPENKH